MTPCVLWHRGLFYVSFVIFDYASGSVGGSTTGSSGNSTTPVIVGAAGAGGGTVSIALTYSLC